MQTLPPTSEALAGNRPLIRFLLVAAAMYLVWVVGYEYWLGPNGKLDMLLCNQLTGTSVAVLRMFGFVAAVDSTKASMVLMDGQPSVITFAPCDGMVLYALFTGFVLAFPGPWKHKAWYIPCGIFLIWVLNVLRIAALALNHHYAPPIGRFQPPLHVHLRGVRVFVRTLDAVGTPPGVPNPAPSGGRPFTDRQCLSGAALGGVRCPLLSGGAW